MTCPICNSEMTSTKVTCDQYVYFRCDQCTHIMLEISKDINIDFQRHYRDHMSRTGELKDNKLTPLYDSNRQGLLDGRLDMIDKYIKKDSSIFEIGCGGGYMLNHFKKGGHTVDGIELDPISVAHCIQRGLDCAESDFLSYKIDKKYDTVISYHVLEHIYDVTSFMSKAIEMTNDMLIIEIPCDREMITDAYGGHLHNFTTESFRTLIDKFGLKDIYFGNGLQTPAILYIGEKLKQYRRDI